MLSECSIEPLHRSVYWWRHDRPFRYAHLRTTHIRKICTMAQISYISCSHANLFTIQLIADFSYFAN